MESFPFCQLVYMLAKERSPLRADSKSCFGTEGKATMWKAWSQATFEVKVVLPQLQTILMPQHMLDDVKLLTYPVAHKGSYKYSLRRLAFALPSLLRKSRAIPPKMLENNFKMALMLQKQGYDI